jgi:hypothetical protein
VKQVRKRLTYANVMSSIAVFLILGGATAIAAKKIGTKQLKAGAVTTGKIKKEAVTTAKIKKDAVTGAKVNESSLGEVPSAASAKNAENANTVGGLRIVKFSLNGGSDIAKTQILDLNGLQLHASCTAGVITATATTSVNGSEISTWAEDASETPPKGKFDDELNVGETFTLSTASPNDVIGDGAYTGGDLRTVRFFYNEEDDIGTTKCLFNGYAIG